MVTEPYDVQHDVPLRDGASCEEVTKSTETVPLLPMEKMKQQNNLPKISDESEEKLKLSSRKAIYTRNSDLNSTENVNLKLHIMFQVFQGGTMCQELQVLQPEKSMTFTAGETATLHCTVTSLIPVGPVKWIRKTEESRELIYNFQEGHFPRVTSASDVTRKNSTDFTIHIHDIKLADAGTYFCMKFQNRIPFDMVLKSGPGTLVTVRGGLPPHPEFSGPLVSALPRHIMSIICKSQGFSSRNISLTWFKNGNVLSASQTRVDPKGDSFSYSISLKNSTLCQTLC
ncbi:signal-regulatory protein beta-1-like [Suncus etruscus]|uniref:signal-regulatory protein beta-1-like n=1 Tax=Suncus etruscus TaxID=109475 RepID=UPI00210FE6DE|nr:signal-regulatory protein beta-1-like [Suncus etruscus]